MLKLIEMPPRRKGVNPMGAKEGEVEVEEVEDEVGEEEDS